MKKNIVIFSDGTGQRSGLFYDENRSNIYKLYRATRCGPDLNVDPNEQLAFYDPGIGTHFLSSNFIIRLFQRIYNMICQATGLGLTDNIIDCYAAIIRKWRRGDRIFLFGFSRGAYTVRSLAVMLSLCGIPTEMPEGKPLLRDKKHSKKIAKEAVRKVYQHTSSVHPDHATPRQKELLEQRRLLAAKFRQKYKSGDEGANDEPFFIGVFDTVSAVARWDSVLLIFGIIIVLFFLLSYLFSLWVFSLQLWFILFLSSSFLILAFLYFKTRIKIPGALPGYSAWKTCTCNKLLMSFDDMRLSRNVKYARHAISIDEDRKAFQRLGWGTMGDPNPKDENGINQFEQFWFAGNHSDIGGSYSENEARLSDISLKWMLDAAVSVGLKYDPNHLQLHPCPYGPQHDERKSSIIFRIAGTSLRKIDPQATLHPSVLERFKADAVLHYDEMKPYRPEALRDHCDARIFY